MDLFVAIVTAAGTVSSLAGAILLLRSKIPSEKLSKSWLGTELGAGDGKRRNKVAHIEKYRVYASRGSDFVTIVGAVIATIGWIVWFSSM